MYTNSVIYHSISSVYLSWLKCCSLYNTLMLMKNDVIY